MRSVVERQLRSDGHCITSVSHSTSKSRPSENILSTPMVAEIVRYIMSFNGMGLANDDMSLLRTTCPSIDDFRNQVYSTAYSIITVFGLVGNGFALLVLLRTFQQRSPFYVYMLNLVVSDLLCVSMLPLRVDYYFNEGQWNQGDFLCRVSSYSLYVNLYCSIFFMTGISFTRFLAIVFPVRSLDLAIERKAGTVCICIWVFICACCSPFLIQGEYVDEETNKTKCYEPPEYSDKLLLKLGLNYFSLVVGFIIPFLMIMLFYVAMMRVLLYRINPSRGKQRATLMKAIRMIIIVMVTFLVCFMPYHIQRTVHLHFMSPNDTTCEEVITMQKSVVVTLCLAASNTCFDPLLYFFSGENFRVRLSTFRSAAPSVLRKCHSEQPATPSNNIQLLKQGDQQACNGPSKVT
ncbi:cysteinyl leukotriene receptor 1-like [Alosa sapidissima]|uniref:cysteinyl leukotriene receptor 1-like n=1 Tax=Alosa sapidissima TaxID=34773 RepID=UPI001C080035|nr:cysteinyl leukotriene receptor 1-like [Alosa sapidissima]